MRCSQGGNQKNKKKNKKKKKKNNKKEEEKNKQKAPSHSSSMAPLRPPSLSGGGTRVLVGILEGARLSLEEVEEEEEEEEEEESTRKFPNSPRCPKANPYLCVHGCGPNKNCCIGVEALCAPYGGLKICPWATLRDSFDEVPGVLVNAQFGNPTDGRVD